jgi:hypothetical protein
LMFFEGKRTLRWHRLPEELSESITGTDPVYGYGVVARADVQV